MLRERELLENAEIVAIVETHLTDKVPDAEVEMKGFTLFRADRQQGTKKGGVALFVGNKLASRAVILTAGSNGVVEYLVLWLNHLRLALVLIYRPPTCEMRCFEPVLSHIRDKLEELGAPLPTLIMMGDYNFPSMCWETGAMYGGMRKIIKAFGNRLHSPTIPKRIPFVFQGSNLKNKRAPDKDSRGCKDVILSISTTIY
jgi:hypothetical protein